MVPAEIDAELPDAPLPTTWPLEWGTALAHWGDTMAAMSNAQGLMNRIGQAKCSMLYMGPDVSIAEFLRAQPWVDEVEAFTPDHYEARFEIAARSLLPVECWLPRSVGIDPVDIWPTHLNGAWERTYRCEPLDGAALPEKRREWARSAINRYPGTKRFLLNPSSTWSAKASEHWPFWDPAIRWLLSETPHTYLLVGTERTICIRHPRLIDLTGQTETNMEVLALADLCDGVTSTCNNLSMWTVIQGLPGLIMGNEALNNVAGYFRRFIDRAPNTYLHVDTPFCRFVDAAEEWMQART